MRPCWPSRPEPAIASTSGSRAPAKLSSSTSDLFGGIYARGGAADAVGDLAWVQAMLDVEAALARACAAEGLIPAGAADAIARACEAQRFDVAGLERATADTASPVMGLVAALRAAVPSGVADHVHLGATSQDVVDTAMMLVIRRACTVIVGDAAAAADVAARLADVHRGSTIMGRTLLQAALPTSFGLKAAGWLVGLEEAIGELVRVRDTVLAVQMGGPVGHRDPAVARRVAAELELAEPALAWHTDRVRPASAAAALGILCGVLAKIARDVVLLAQTDVAEASEGGDARGGSTAMAHKRNPVAAVSVLACAARPPGLVATMLACMVQEHERAAGAWQAEWGTMTDLLRLTGSAAEWTRDLLEHLRVDTARMRDRAVRGDGVDDGAWDVLVDRALALHDRAPR